jgi:hypothetical protein
VRFGSFVLALAVVGLCGCSKKASHEKYEIAFSLSPSLSGRTIMVAGTTDLPDGALINYEIEHEQYKHVDFGSDRKKFLKEVNLTFADGSTPVKSGHYAHAVDISGWRPGSVQVWAAFEPVMQPESVAEKYGKQGEYLKGSNVNTTEVAKTGSFSRVELTRTVHITRRN